MTRGWVIGLVSVAVALCFAVSCGEKAKTATGGARTGAAPQPSSITYADLSTKVKEAVDKAKKEAEEAAANLPPEAKAAGAQIPDKSGMAVGLMTRNFELKDTGTVVSSAKGGDGQTHVMLDMNGDGQPDVDLTIGTAAAPADGAKVSFTGKIVNAKMNGDKLEVTATGTLTKAGA
jgi:hypothetical protein